MWDKTAGALTQIKVMTTDLVTMFFSATYSEREKKKASYKISLIKKYPL